MRAQRSNTISPLISGFEFLLMQSVVQKFYFALVSPGSITASPESVATSLLRHSRQS